MIDDDMELIDLFELDEGEIYNDDDDNDDGYESRVFWQTQHCLLQEALSRSHSIERKIRINTEQALRRLRSDNEVRNKHCILRDVVDCLCERGYDGAICKSKWKRSFETLSGEHCFIDVMVEPRNGGKEPARIVVELEFRAEFEMARASAEYGSLVRSLPEIFVGRPERLRSVVRIMCDAAKKSAKDNKMHIAPWRKHKYMHSKWLGAFERVRSGPVPITAGSSRPVKPMASMLTFDLRCAAEKVVDMDAAVRLLTLF